MTLPLLNLDDRTWADLVQEGRALIPQYAPQWTDHNAHDPGITLLELLAYHTEQEIYRLNTVGAAHRQAFLGLFGAGFQPRGPRPATTLLVYEPAPVRSPRRPKVRAGDYFRPWNAATDPADDGPDLPDPPGLRPPGYVSDPATHMPGAVRPVRGRWFGYRAAHDLSLTGIRLVTVQSFDGHIFRDLTEVLTQARPPAAWGDDPVPPEHLPPDRQPALYLGLNVDLWTPGSGDLTLWFVPDGYEAGRLVPEDGAGAGIDLDPAAPPPPWEPATDVDVSYHPYDDHAPLPTHHGQAVEWEYQDGGLWRPVPSARFRDETRGFTRPGRVVLPAAVFARAAAPAGRLPVVVVGAAPSAHFYVRCRLARGRPDAPPRLRGVFADAVLVEQRCRSETELRPGLEGGGVILQLRDLQLSETAEADVHDAAVYLAARGWGPWALAWGEWPVTSRPLRELLAPGPDDGDGGRPKVVPFVVLGAGTGEPGQRFKLPTPAAWPGAETASADEPEDDAPPTVLADALRVWTMEPAWGWDPNGPRAQAPFWHEQLWMQVPDLVLCDRTTPGFRYEPAVNQVVFGDGEAGRVPPPGAVVVVGYGWTEAERGNLAAGLLWGRADDPEASRRGGAGPTPALRFHNPLPTAGGRPAEELTAALQRLVAAFGATDRLVELAAQAKADTLDGVDLTGVPPPPTAVTLLDFECLARSVPGTTVVRARAWAGTDPQRPEMTTPGVVTVVIVPALPADRPEPMPGLLRRVAAHLEAHRPITCRVCVTGPVYQPVRVQATLHAALGTGADVRQRAVEAIKTYLHPLRGGPGGTGWPFGRAVHLGEIQFALARVEGVRAVTDLKLAAGEASGGEAAVPLAPLALVAAAEPVLDVQEDA